MAPSKDSPVVWRAETRKLPCMGTCQLKAGDWRAVIGPMWLEDGCFPNQWVNTRTGGPSAELDELVTDSIAHGHPRQT